MKYKILILTLVILASGCTDFEQRLGGEKKAELIAQTTDSRITNSSPGRITLNARNLQANDTFFYAVVSPVGDYEQVVRVKDRNGNIKSGFGLGDAPQEATTGEVFAEVHKKMNISSNVRVKVELYNRDQVDLLDEKTLNMKVIEEQPED
mgnify:CR=1 FL=1